MIDLKGYDDDGYWRVDVVVEVDVFVDGCLVYGWVDVDVIDDGGIDVLLFVVGIVVCVFVCVLVLEFVVAVVTVVTVVVVVVGKLLNESSDYLLSLICTFTIVGSCVCVILLFVLLLTWILLFLLFLSSTNYIISTS